MFFCVRGDQKEEEEEEKKKTKSNDSQLWKYFIFPNSFSFSETLREMADSVMFCICKQKKGD